MLSGGAALVSILSYTSSAGIAVPGMPSAASRAHSVTVAPALDTAAAVGDTIQLAAVITDSGGTVLAGVAPTWTSGDPSIAEVSPAGTVAIRGAGATAIMVRVGNVETRAHIVVLQRPASLQVDDTLLQVPEGDRRPLSARVLDARGNPIVGADVTWSAPDPAVAKVESADAVGVSAGRTLFLAMAGQLQASLPLEVTPVAGSITVLGGDGQRGPAGAELSVPVTAQIVSRSGRPIAGVVAGFHPAASGASARAGVRYLGCARDREDGVAAGRAARTATAVHRRRGRERVTDGERRGGPPAGQRAGGDRELRPGRPGGRYAAVSRSSCGSPTRLAARWPICRWGGARSTAESITGQAMRTDSLGEARATWKLGTKAGRQRARVQVGNARTMPPVGLMAAAEPGPAAAVRPVSGDRQTGSVGQPLPQAIVLRAIDRHGNPVAGAVLRLLPAAGRPADNELSTDSTGRAKVVWTLGRTAGLQRLTARLQGDTAETEITAVARPGKAVKLAFVDPPVGGKAGRALPKPLVVQVTDSYGNPIAGQTVLFKASSGTVTPTRGLSDVDGHTSVRWTLGPKSQRPELSAKVPGTVVSRTLTLGAKP